MRSFFQAEVNRADQKINSINDVKKMTLSNIIQNNCG